MRRREFITVLSGAAVAWPLTARAQQSAMPVIGFLSSASPDGYAIRLHAFRQGLKDTGYVEGQNVAIEYRWADGQYDRLPALAAELVHRQVAVIVAGGGTPSAVAAKAATTTIPIVFAVSVDPVKIGFVATSPSIAEGFLRALQPAARALGLQLHVLNASTDRDFDPVFATMVQLRADALVISPDTFFNTRIERLAMLSLHHAVPAIYQYRPFVAAGGVIGYGSDETEYYSLVGNYAGKVLKGEKPADLPVVQSTKVELIINLNTAKALGLTVPLSLLGRADEVIE